MQTGPSSSSSSASPLHALQSALRPVIRPAVDRPHLLVAGATGALGSEVLRRLAGSSAFSHAEVLAREPITTGLAQVTLTLVTDDDPAHWPLRTLQGATGVIMFEPPRLYYDRERALWTPAPQQLMALAQWLQRCGVQTLVVVVPHARGSLPEALKQGLASLHEHSVAALGFERVLFVRSAQKPAAAGRASLPARLAAWMLSTLNYMVPQTGQPVRPAKLAEFVEAALRVLPPGTHVASPELLWRAAQAGAAGAADGKTDIHSVVQAWLNASLGQGAVGRAQTVEAR